jgi:hypothetical protein
MTTDSKPPLNPVLSAWLSGKSKAPTQFQPPKNAKLIKTREDLTPFQGKPLNG